MTGAGLTLGIVAGFVTLVARRYGPRALRQLSEWSRRRSAGRRPLAVNAPDREN